MHKAIYWSKEWFGLEPNGNLLTKSVEWANEATAGATVICAVVELVDNKEVFKKVIECIDCIALPPGLLP